MPGPEGERKVIAGDYLLDKKVGPVDIAYRLVKGDFHTEAQKVTIPEGWDIYEIAEYLEKNLVNFKRADFSQHFCQFHHASLEPRLSFLSGTRGTNTACDPFLCQKGGR